MGSYLQSMDNADDFLAPDTTKVSLDQRVIVPAFGLGRFAPFNWERLPHSTGVRLFWGRIAAWLVVLACVGWLLLATVLYGFVKYRRGFTDVSFQHMLLLPWQLDDYRRAKGEFLIKEGLDLAEKQEWRPAFDLLRTGLAAVPDHLEARVLVARIYLMAGRPDMVRTLLIEGLAYHANQLGYLHEVLGYFISIQADETVIAVTTDLRTRLPADSDEGRLVSTALAFSYFYTDRPIEAEAVLRESRLAGTAKGQLLLARIEWEQGGRAEARAKLRALHAQVPQDNEIYRTQLEYLREEKRWAELRRVSLLQQFAMPERAEAYVDFIAACADEGDEQARAKAEGAFLEKFSGDMPALLKLGEEAARAGRVEVVEKVVARFRALGREVADAEMLLLLTHLERREYDAVLSATARLSAEAAKWPERQRLVMGGLKAAALYGRGEELEAEPLVRRLCETRLLPATLLTALAEQLEKAGQGEQARRVLRHAVEIDPLHQPALVMLLRSALAAQELGDTVPLIERLLTMRKPRAELLAGLDRGLGSDRYLLLPGRVRVQEEIGRRLGGGQ
jgi:tetratricopeptide (TPR) repeat protein